MSKESLPVLRESPDGKYVLTESGWLYNPFPDGWDGPKARQQTQDNLAMVVHRVNRDGKNVVKYKDERR